MELGAVGDPRGVCRATPAGTCIIPRRPRPPVRILQQLPGPAVALEPGPGAPRVRGGFMELMMIQSSHMHQVLMNSLALSALTAFGLGPSPAAAQAMEEPLQTVEGEEAMVFHHHYIPYLWPLPVLSWPGPVQEWGPAAVRYLGSGAEDAELAVPPPPPPSATGTVGASIPPASEYYNVVEERL
ncbi:proline-rich protein 29 [Pezoporus wallicus]|uniref:proline-rich protein 29 n=1 Tax=Pezoporus wallicus TaxID=35540 RepID=UPI00254A8064|nr:proline-rich protein 29 [Pezoporus wallicus]XP_061333611.1 proline-rich protein 29 [Pezoporus flaviventris]